MATAEIFRALGDPIRLEMVQRLTKGGRCTITVLSEGLGVSRQGARKHLQVLADASLIALRPQGRDVLVSLDPEALLQARRFIAELERRWDARLEALKRLVEE
ncbi:MAG: helix-turn-helix transcriptional regulator [Acidobacteria bacterium]|nr:helix-turn-helix transcriptional regulator [Acidobacteriota bacterium]